MVCMEIYDRIGNISYQVKYTALINDKRNRHFFFEKCGFEIEIENCLKYISLSDMPWYFII